jgi:hypothetical protein
MTNNVSVNFLEVFRKLKEINHHKTNITIFEFTPVDFISLNE